MEIRPDHNARLMIDKIKHLTPQITHAIDKANNEANVLMTREKDKQILDTKSKTGVLYIRTKTHAKTGAVLRNKKGKAIGFPVRRSAKYETPTEETGAYRKSFEFIGRGVRGFTFGTTSPYGGYLEDGTSKMFPRYGIKNMYNAIKGNLLTVYTKQIERGINLSTKV